MIARIKLLVLFILLITLWANVQEILRFTIKEPIIRLKVLIIEVLEIVLVLLIFFHKISNVLHVIILQKLNQAPKSLITIQKCQFLRYYYVKYLK